MYKPDRRIGQAHRPAGVKSDSSQWSPPNTQLLYKNNLHHRVISDCWWTSVHAKYLETWVESLLESVRNKLMSPRGRESHGKKRRHLKHNAPLHNSNRSTISHYKLFLTHYLLFGAPTIMLACANPFLHPCTSSSLFFAFWNSRSHSLLCHFTIYKQCFVYGYASFPTCILSTKEVWRPVRWLNHCQTVYCVTPVRLQAG